MKNTPHKGSKIVVLEIERVQLVRRKCRAHSRFCEKCENEVDFIPLMEAARLFDLNSDRLFRFVQSNKSHYKSDEKGDIFLCVNSLFACVNAKTGGSKLKMISDGDKAAEINGDMAAEFS
jgi:hypothetical protein